MHVLNSYIHIQVVRHFLGNSNILEYFYVNDIPYKCLITVYWGNNISFSSQKEKEHYAIKMIYTFFNVSFFLILLVKNICEEAKADF